jgi:ABC-type lipoprotein export system ATPase subunit
VLGDVCRDRGTAVLLVTHDPEAVAHAARVRVLRDGRLTDEHPGESVAWPSLR